MTTPPKESDATLAGRALANLRTKALSKRRLSAIARNAAQVRWKREAEKKNK
jgi:hypothetical protein